MKNSKQGFGQTEIIIGIAVLVLIVGVGYYVTKRGDSTMIKEEAGSVLAGTTSPLLDFTKADYDAALTTDKLIVLYFYANWCPICKAETRDALYPAFNELTGDKVIGFRVNYNDSDTDADEEALAREFGVAYQHTKVFVKDGQKILKSPEGWDKDRYLAQIEEFVIR